MCSWGGDIAPGATVRVITVTSGLAISPSGSCISVFAATGDMPAMWPCGLADSGAVCARSTATGAPEKRAVSAKALFMSRRVIMAAFPLETALHECPDSRQRWAARPRASTPSPPPEETQYSPPAIRRVVWRHERLSGGAAGDGPLPPRREAPAGRSHDERHAWALEHEHLVLQFLAARLAQIAEALLEQTGAVGQQLIIGRRTLDALLVAAVAEPFRQHLAVGGPDQAQLDRVEHLVVRPVRREVPEHPLGRVDAENEIVARIELHEVCGLGSLRDHTPGVVDSQVIENRKIGHNALRHLWSGVLQVILSDDPVPRRHHRSARNRAAQSAEHGAASHLACGHGRKRRPLVLNYDDGLALELGAFGSQGYRLRAHAPRGQKTQQRRRNDA